MGRLIVLGFEDRTHKCCKILRKSVVRGERLIKLSDSWFSAKSIDVERFLFFIWGTVIFLEV
jgi:hypothetical protein